MKLDHATTVTSDLESARRFLCDIASLRAGPRPPFRIGGYWLYANDRPVIHLVQSTFPAVEGRTSPRIDHIALRVDDVAEWAALVDRIGSKHIPFTLAEVTLTNELQLFVSLAPGVAIEFVTKLSNSRSTLVK